MITNKVFIMSENSNNYFSSIIPGHNAPYLIKNHYPITKSFYIIHLYPIIIIQYHSNKVAKMYNSQLKKT